MKHVVLLLTLLLLLTSCATQVVCDDDDQSYMVARFKTLALEDGSVRDTIISGMSIYGIREGMIFFIRTGRAWLNRPIPHNPHDYWLSPTSLRS